MRKQILASLIAAATMMGTGCAQSGKKQRIPVATTSITDSFSRFMSKDTANKMIGSYLNSINYLTNDTDLRSLCVDVGQLRKYIDSMPNSKDMRGIKLIFSHTLNYTNSPDVNHFSGYNSKKLTLVIAAYDSIGNYMYYDGNNVLDYSSPCPPSCPPGNAGGALLTN